MIAAEGSNLQIKFKPLAPELQAMLKQQESLEAMIKQTEKDVEEGKVGEVVNSFQENRDILRTIKMEIDMIFAQ